MQPPSWKILLKNCISYEKLVKSGLPTNKPHTTHNLYTIFPLNAVCVRTENRKNYYVCMCFLWNGEEKSRGEGCAIDFLFSSRANNILWLALARNMKWKSTKLWNIYFFLSSDRTCVVMISSLLRLRYLHVLFPFVVWEVHLWVRNMILMSWNMKTASFAALNAQLTLRLMCAI